jgi:phosphopantothenoylcysteine decarboxylase/phosphopantothenate--cysteine ligase
MTPAAERFVGAATFSGITGAPALADAWARDPARGAFPDQEPPRHDPISHLALVGNADAYLIAPATAHTLARLAHGFADDLVCEAALAAGCPVLVAPAMNDRMWSHAATRANVALLRDRGVTVIEPGTGELASRGEHGPGRLAEPSELLAAVESVLPARATGPSGTAGTAAPVNGHPPIGRWSGLRVLVTAGGTREPIDAVRFVGNRSSGRMGWALADEAARRGAEAEVIAANVSLPRTPGVSYRDVMSAAELHDAALAAFERCDVLLMAAAVADFRPRQAAAIKLRKDAGPPRLELEATPDVLAALGARRRAGQTLVGFAAETGGDAVERGRAKLERKRLDLVAVNDVSTPEIGFDAADNEVVLLGRDGAELHVPRAGKDAVASAILDEVMRLRTLHGATREPA